jgi:hypothetical protein
MTICTHLSSAVYPLIGDLDPGTLAVVTRPHAPHEVGDIVMRVFSDGGYPILNFRIPETKFASDVLRGRPLVRGDSVTLTVGD